jgi:hypothetical protein
VTLSEGLARWGGACAGVVYRCLLVVDAPTEVVVTGYPPSAPPPPPPPPPRVDITVSGTGVVQSSDGLLSCGRSGGLRLACRMVWADGHAFLLRAVPGRRARFTRWDGSCQGTKARCSSSKLRRLGRNYALTALFRVKR